MADTQSFDAHACVTGFFGAVTIFAVLSHLPPIVASITGGGAITMGLFSLRKAMKEVTARKVQPKIPNKSPPNRNDNEHFACI
jgi:hypothetical protein